jgi:glutathione S-transferase
MIDDHDLMDSSVDEERLKEELRRAAKRYRRQRSLQDTVFGIAFVALAVMPYWFGLERKDLFFWYFGLAILAAIGQVYRHIRAMQLRLAEMHEEIDRLRGNEYTGHMLDEYSAGP